ncbi:MAG: hypothetical protein KDE22_15615 [Rhodobacterales bacterium]|nr:hypothetical protein [Rhodobacterales bacterium]
MADLNSVTALFLGPDRVAGGRPQGYQAAREVNFRAAVSREGETTRNRAALDRLDRLLASGQPLDPNVPRGHYLNIRI